VGAKLSPAETKEWIVNAPAMTAKMKADRKPAMKAYATLPAADVDALVAYLQTLKK
jgi:cbb3-type cytochrome oxidase cytochrome c subunit